MPIPAPRDAVQSRSALTAWLTRRHPEATDVWVSEVTVPSFTGFSNETLLFDAAWTVDGEKTTVGMVARVEPTTHTVFLEAQFEVQYRVMEILREKTDIPMPELYGFESDTSILGAPFLVMEKIEGRVPTDTPPYHTGGWVTEISPEERASMWWSGLGAMARIHRLDWRELGLGFLDRPARGRTGLAQQLNYYEDYYAWAAEGATAPNIVADRALEWIKAHPPGEEEIRLCWGDSRVGNMIFENGVCVAVLDWEMVTLGNPVQDLAWWLFLDRHHSEGMGVAPLEGFPTREETVAEWEAQTGLAADPDTLFFYEVFAAFRFAVVMQRLSTLVVEFELVPADSDMAVNNTVTQLLAKMLDLPAPGGS